MERRTDRWTDGCFGPPSEAEGYLQKVSRNMGRSRCRKPNRGTKLVRLTEDRRRRSLIQQPIRSEREEPGSRRDVPAYWRCGG